ncbi:MAG: cytochrome c oxidase assembly protein subunit 15 [Fibrobacteres bacterium]|nr:cytochrome c oxidase assembly protein subunit 15 [Fibrobacterota bacterium]
MTPQSPVRYRAAFHYYGIALSICTFLLLFAGGMVTSTNSGLSVPDWPTTFGKNMFLFPPSMMKGGIFYEHGHRLFASLVGLLTVGNCLAVWFLDARKWLRWTGALALFLVIVQGVLGGMTVRYKLPMPVSAAHACTAELFFGLTVFMAFATSRSWLRAAPGRLRLSLPEQALSLAFCMAVFLQILVGAVMRHSYAGLSIPTFPLAYGQIVPPFWNFGIIVHFLHTRVGASLLVILGALLIFTVMTSKRLPRSVKGLAGFLAFALIGQCLLGMMTIWTGKAPVPTTFHLSLGALVFATGLLLFLAIYRLQRPVSRQAESKGSEMNPDSNSRLIPHETDGVRLT